MHGSKPFHIGDICICELRYECRNKSSMDTEGQLSFAGSQKLCADFRLCKGHCSWLHVTWGSTVMVNSGRCRKHNDKEYINLTIPLASLICSWKSEIYMVLFFLQDSYELLITQLSCWENYACVCVCEERESDDLSPKHLALRVIPICFYFVCCSLLVQTSGHLSEICSLAFSCYHQTLKPHAAQHGPFMKLNISYNFELLCDFIWRWSDSSVVKGWIDSLEVRTGAMVYK